jgi:hypothetical protein
MWLRSNAGGILIAPRIEDMEGLYDELAQWNPNANITQPTSIFGRSFR